jgi:hypothetical protein
LELRSSVLAADFPVPEAQSVRAEVPACSPELHFSAPAVDFRELAVLPGSPELFHWCALAAGSRALEAH